ncbi:AsmA-like C-terminal region-containing protein [Hymenobacter sp. 15J16-1T3B]|uniref:AsmA-like C-terminal region-containing protein n=1 Tax=Hymenobacter sp. 15J16-1T3B TaxID=2886941 RepID=UPI001D0FCB10|nr:AsmA-like C-terminal region-containing protein [Hymenobacter sp. 15J16-1T3B]MCC3157258.1 AsmA-like C-terminal region-containing protein [Hymenobacter sp. 15J16-1T3B]
MARFGFRRGAGLLLGLVLLGLLLGAGLLGTRYGRAYLARHLRQQLAESSDLVVSPFELHLSWRDFPHLTAAVRHLTLTDTAYQRAEPVLQVDRADLRLNLQALLRGQVRVDVLTLRDGLLRAYVDSLGRRWTLHGRRRSGPGQPPPLDVELPTVQLRNVRLSFRNDYKRSRFAAQVVQGQFQLRLRGGQLTVRGALGGRLDSLHNGRTGTLLAHEPVQARARYRYDFRRRRGTFEPGTYATLRGDTIRIGGTHTTAARAPAGSWLHLRFEGRQRLMDVLPAVLPPSLLGYLRGARSPSQAHLRYTVSGLSSPTVLPRNVLRLELRRARLVWPDSSRRISRWDLVGVLDNGAAHQPRTTTLTLQRCRIYSPLGQLDLHLQVRDFTRPTVNGRLRGRTDVPALAALVAPGAWRAHGGAAELDVRLRGPLPPGPNQSAPPGPAGSLSVRGHVALHHASFDIPSRHARVRALNVRLGLQDSLWQLNDLSGQVDGMRFQAQARTVNLLDYLTGQRATTRIDGRFAVDELRVARLGELLRPRLTGPARSRRPTKAAADSSLLPPGLRLRVALRCARLVLPTDTLRQLRALVRRDGWRTTLSGLSARVWGGEMLGRAAWPGPLARGRSAGEFQLTMRFGTVDYQRVARLLRRSVRPAAGGPPGAAARPRIAAGQSPLRRLLLTANGQISCQVNALQMPVGENLRQVRLQVVKSGSTFRMPALYFATTSGGVGFAQASARMAGPRLLAADASLDLRYASVDVQRLLLLLASLQPDDDDEEATADTLATAAAEPARPGAGRASALLSGNLLTARLHVRAEHVRYGALSGTGFRLTSHLRPGEARLDECTLQAFGGQLRLRGRLQTNAGQGHHPLHAQAQLQDIQLPRLFELAEALGFDVLGPANVRGTMTCEADVHTDLDATFLPAVARTQGYARADVQNLELLRVAPLQQALRLLSPHRTEHLYFRPVSTRFFLDQERLLVPELRLNSNLTDLEISGVYFLTGRSNLYVGLNPMQAVLGNFRQRTARIRDGAPARRPDRHLLYVNLRRPHGRMRYSVRPFKRREKEEQQARLQQEYRQLLLRQPIDTTLRLLRAAPLR